MVFVLGASVVAFGLFLPGRAITLGTVPDRLIACFRWLILFHGEPIERTAQVLVVFGLFVPALAITPFLIWALQRHRLKEPVKLLGAGLIPAALVAAGAMATEVLAPQLRHAAEWMPFPSLSGLLPAALAGAIVFGLVLLHRGWMGRLLAATGAAFLLLATLHIWIDHFHNPWFISSADIRSLSWKLPLLLAGSLPLAVLVSRRAAEDRRTYWFHGASLSFIFCCAIFLAPFRFPERWDSHEIEGLRGVHLAPNGDLFLLAYKREFENDLSYSDAVLVRLHDQPVLRCLSKRPFALSISPAPLVSPDGSRVAMTEFATPWESLTGTQSFARIRSVDGVLAATVATIPRENAPEDGRGDRLVLGPSRSWVLPLREEIVGDLMDGRPFRIPISGTGRVSRIWIADRTLRIFRNDWSEGGKASLDAFSLERGTFARSSIGIDAPVLLTSVSPDGQEMVVMSFIANSGKRLEAFWIDRVGRVKSLGAARTDEIQRWRIPGAPSGTETIVWRQAGPISIGGYVDVQDVAGRLLALTVPATHISKSDLVELDNSTFGVVATLAVGIDQAQFLHDSVLYLQSTNRGHPAFKVIRHWSAAGRAQLLFAIPALE